MHSDSLAMPFLPRRLSPATAPEAATPWLGLDLEKLSRHRAERRLERSARRREPIVLGTVETPYEPWAQSAAPLAALRRFDGLAISITTRASEILEQLDLLVELDQRHAVAVDLLVATLDPDSADLAERLRAVSALASHGITARLVLTDLPASPTGRVSSRVRRLLEAARDQGAFDVAAVFEPGAEAEAWSRFLRYLRFELGFPRSTAGRG